MGCAPGINVGLNFSKFPLLQGWLNSDFYPLWLRVLFCFPGWPTSPPPQSLVSRDVGWAAAFGGEQTVMGCLHGCRSLGQPSLWWPVYSTNPQPRSQPQAAQMHPKMAPGTSRSTSLHFQLKRIYSAVHVQGTFSASEIPQKDIMHSPKGFLNQQ